jgi:FAD/FMN-containing dehydrogenase
MSLAMGSMSRRDVLRLAGTMGAAGVLAACGKHHAPAAAPKPSPDPSASMPVPTPSVTPSFATPSPTATPLPPAPDWSKLSKNMHGSVLLPSDTRYASAAQLYNPRFDATTHPTAVAQCTADTDVAAAVAFAADTRYPFAIRSGGHSYAGWSTSPGLVIDVSQLKKVVVDTASKTARIGAGAKLGDVYAALAAKGMSIAAGSCPTVGFGGLVQGGGIGVLTRAYGLTSDSVRAVDLVTADGKLRQVNSSTDSDLFWAVRGGGGGSFGAATGFTVAVKPAPTVQTFYYAWPFEHANQLLEQWQIWIAGADRRITSTCKLLSDPGSATQTALIAGTWIGKASDLTKQLNPLLSKLPKPATTVVHSHTYAEAMLLEAGCSTGTASACITNAMTPANRQAFAATSSVLYGKLNSLAIRTVVDNANAAMNLTGLIEGGVSFDSLGGAMLDLDDDSTAFAHRDAAAIVQYTATYGQGLQPTMYDSYVRTFRSTMGLWMGTDAYVNYADPTIVDYGAAYWSDSYPRLQQVKKRYDPNELFTFPQAVRPTTI